MSIYRYSLIYFKGTDRYSLRMRTSSHRRSRQRKQLEARLEKLDPALAGPPPRAGWIRALRESLGLSAEQLALRIGVTKRAVLALEEREFARTISLQSLDRLAAGLGCEVVYAVVPKRSLEQMIEDQSRIAARA